MYQLRYYCSLPYFLTIFSLLLPLLFWQTSLPPFWNGSLFPIHPTASPAALPPWFTSPVAPYCLLWSLSPAAGTPSTPASPFTRSVSTAVFLTTRRDVMAPVTNRSQTMGLDCCTVIWISGNHVLPNPLRPPGGVPPSPQPTLPHALPHRPGPVRVTHLPGPAEPHEAE